ncbi:MAG: hypothetical protein JO353_05280, partial [Phycisphaerae bacterium]|nr:hypothetical protein [Phycisphaerae bacterium]
MRIVVSAVGPVICLPGTLWRTHRSRFGCGWDDTSAEKHIMRADRIGDILSRIIPLSGHDIEEILQEQRSSHRRFGDIALAMGLCQPADVWRAWSGQLDCPEGGVRHIDLDAVGIDSQAIEFMSAIDARRWTAIPVRVFGDELVVAVDRA